MRPRWPVAEVAAGVGAERPSDEAARALGIWLDALAEWNAKIDLTAAKDDRAIAWLMLADAMVLAPALGTGSSVVDVGSGAGAPGLAIAILRPDLRVTLCEPLGKRAAFLRSVIGSLGRADVRIEPRRADALPRGAFDVAISRATFPPAEWLALGAELVRSGGDVWVFLAPKNADEAPPEDARCRLEETRAYVDGVTGANKRLVRFSVRVAP